MKSRNPRFVGRLVLMMRKDRGMRQSELASITGLKQPNLSRIENGLVMPRQATLEKLAKALDLAVADLFDDKKLAGLEQKWSGGAASAAVAVDGQLTVPLIATTEGYKLDIGNNGVPTGASETTLVLPALENIGHCFALRVFGDAMESTRAGGSFRHDDIVVFSDRPAPKPGDFALVRTLDGYNFRRLYYEEDTARLVPLNPSYSEKNMPRRDLIKAWKLIYHVTAH
ncbi:MAG TPA: XRE family transcriptional regulator [Planctomycetota bacterium]|nr:XRE family transcriptional regulator [Planctomycetota bacterium]